MAAMKMCWGGTLSPMKTTVPSLAVRAAAHGPIGTAIGNSVNQNFPWVIINHKAITDF
jgi:hypothetical protein